MKQYEEKQQCNEDWKDQQACSYAALICFDVGVEINEENINRLLDAAKLRVKKYWPELFCRLIKSKGLTDLISNSVNVGDSIVTKENRIQNTRVTNKEENSKKEEKDSVAEESSASAAALFNKSDSDVS